MSLPRGAVKYTCPCGAHYLIAIDHEGQADDWLNVVREAADQLGIQAIDGRQAAFTCSSCGRVHERRVKPLPGSHD